MLTIELVPETSWFTNLRSLLKEGEWDVLRKQCYKEAGYKCEVCGGRGSKWPVECHEIWNYDDEKYTQTLNGLIALCPNCHMVKHIGYAQVNGRGNDALKHLMLVNKWTKIKAEKYIQEAFLKWRERSKHDWKVDTSFLGVEV